jgi:hypothetical protein
MTATTIQNSTDPAKTLALKLMFIPITPAISAPGKSRIDARARTFMISLVRCSVRAITTSNEPVMAFFASRAAVSAASVLTASSLNLLLTAPSIQDRTRVG